MTIHIKNGMTTGKNIIIHDFNIKNHNRLKISSANWV